MMLSWWHHDNIIDVIMDNINDVIHDEISIILT